MVNMKNYEEYMLLYADKELSKEEEQALLAFVAEHPELQKELDAYMATQLQPEAGLVFADKDSLLKQEGGGKTMWLGGWKTYAAAASVILFVVLFNLYSGDETVTETPIAKKDTITTPVTTTPKEAIVKTTEEEPEEDKLQSTQPVNAVAVETTVQPQPKNTQNDKQTNTEENIKEEEAMELLTTSSNEMVAVHQPAETLQEVEMPDAATVVEIMKPEKNTAVQLPNIDGSKQLLAELAGAVTEKLTNAQQIRNDLKDTDLVVRVGKKQLFTVRL